jgi:prolyl-tRNA synthetase
MKDSHRQSSIFSKTRKEAPKDEVSKNAELLIRAGFIHKDMSGVYSFLPLGLRVMKKIEQIVREEMNVIGGQELFLSSLQNKELWERSDRWSDEVVDNWFKTELKNGSEIGLAFTHEEPLTNLMKDHIRSFRDLPVYAYQFQTKFRNEARAKSGIMRGREFLMKDLYSFSKDQAEHDRFYEKAKEAYLKIYERVGLGEKTFLTFASGGSFAKYSHEFQALTEAGEDIIYVDKEKKIAVNREVYNDEVLDMLGLDKSNLNEEKAVEVGNIFSLGTKYSDAIELSVSLESGEKVSVVMGSYGIGISRLMGAIAEVLSDAAGLVWPMNVAPYQLHLIEIPNEKNPEVKKTAEKLFDELSKNYEVLYDDRDVRVGEKFSDADLIGLPYQLIVSDRSLKEESIEIKKRKDQSSELVKLKDIDNMKFL